MRKLFDNICDNCRKYTRDDKPLTFCSSKCEQDYEYYNGKSKTDSALIVMVCFIGLFMIGVIICVREILFH